MIQNIYVISPKFLMPLCCPFHSLPCPSHNHWTTFCHKSLLCILYKWNHTVCSLLHLASAQCIVILRFIHVMGIGNLFLNKSLLHGCTIFYSSSQRLINIWVGLFTVWAMCITLLLIFVYKSFNGNMLPLLLSKYLGVEWLNHMISV